MKGKDSEKTLRDELRQIAPGLSELKQADGFTTPHNYFRELPDRVFAKIAEDEQRPVSAWRWLLSLLKPRYAVAFASVLVLIMAGIWYTRIQSNQEPIVSMTRDEALEYVLANLHEYDNDDLLAAGVFTEWNAEDVDPVTEEELDQMMDVLDEEELIDELVN